MKKEFINLLEDTAISDDRIFYMFKEILKYKEYSYTKKSLIDLALSADIPENRLQTFISELSKIKANEIKIKDEVYFKEWIRNNIFKTEPKFVAKLNPKTVSEILQLSGSKITPQRAGVLISLAGFSGAKNKAHRTIYSLKK